MSKLTEPLKIEVIGRGIIVEGYFPLTKKEESALKQGIKPFEDIEDKNKYWPTGRTKWAFSEFPEHPAQGIVKAISPHLTDEEKGSLKVNNRVAFRPGSGEQIVYKDKVYYRLAPHEIMFKYIGSQR
jgi:hypothetical protein